MKHVLMRFPELAGLMLGLFDAVPRALAAFAFAPSQATLHGMVLVGNVHHLNGELAFGLGTMAWFAVAAAVLVLLYLAWRALAGAMQIDNAACQLARGLFGAVAGVLALNAAEAMFTGKVTNYVGIAYAGRFTAINGGDLLLWLSLAGLLPAAAGAFALHLLDRTRTGCG